MNELIKKLREELPQGSIKKISEYTGIGETTVSNVLNAKYKSLRYGTIILESALKIVEEQREKQKAIEESLKKNYGDNKQK